MSIHSFARAVNLKWYWISLFAVMGVLALLEKAGVIP
jgi:hypothetical protein